MHDDELDELFGPAIEYEQPAGCDDSVDAKYRQIHMIAWMASGGLCGCGKAISFEHYYQYGDCFKCYELEAAGNIE